MPLNERQVAESYDWYADLERRVVAVTDVLPIVSTEIAEHVPTPHLNSVLVEAGAISDSW